MSLNHLKSCFTINLGLINQGPSQQEDEELNYTNDGVMDMLKQKSVMDENREANPNEIIEEEGEGEQ